MLHCGFEDCRFSGRSRPSTRIWPRRPVASVLGTAIGLAALVVRTRRTRFVGRSLQSWDWGSRRWGCVATPARGDRVSASFP